MCARRYSTPEKNYSVLKYRVGISTVVYRQTLDTNFILSAYSASVMAARCTEDVRLVELRGSGVGSALLLSLLFSEDSE